MKTSELRIKTKDELNAELTLAQKELFGLRLQSVTDGNDSASAPHRHSFKQVRRKIARIKTILNEKRRS